MSFAASPRGVRGDLDSDARFQRRRLDVQLASGWLMTTLSPDPFVVALVQAADTLPICLLALPAGALADIFDKRKFLIVVETLTTIVSAIYVAEAEARSGSADG